MLRSILCDYSDTNILVTGTQVAITAAQDAAAKSASIKKHLKFVLHLLIP